MKDDRPTKAARLMRNLLLLYIAAMLASVAVHQCRRSSREPWQPYSSDTIAIERDTIVLHDTIRIEAPRHVDTHSVGDTTIMLPAGAVKADTAAVAPDSLLVQLPMVSRHYADTLPDGNGYDAWVSGPVNPRLDSLCIYPQRILVTETMRIRDPPRRWGLSVGAGIVATPTRIEPGIFIGATYTFVTF